MVESYKTNLKYVNLNWNPSIIELDSLNDSARVDKLRIYIINVRTSPERRIHMINQLKQSNVNMNLVEIVDATVYPKGSTNDEKHKILSLDHARMWQKALDNNLDGALFFEDDVHFLKNWKCVVESIFNLHGDNVNLIRFDSFPLVRIEDLPKNQIVLTNVNSYACVGGYYMSGKAMLTGLSLISISKWKWGTIELLVKHIHNYYTDSSFETSPRICIQNWFLSDKSAMQTSEHMLKLKDIQLGGYLQTYHDMYIFDEETKKILNNLLDEYKTPKYIEKIIK